MKKHPTKPWETSLANSLKRLEIPEEKIEKVLAILWKKKTQWELDAMKSILEAKSNLKPI